MSKARDFIAEVSACLLERKATLSHYRANGMCWEKVGEIDAKEVVDYVASLEARIEALEKQKSTTYKQMVETQTLLEAEHKERMRLRHELDAMVWEVRFKPRAAIARATRK